MNPLLREILSYNRADPIPFINEVLLPFLDEFNLDYEVDKEWNVYVETDPEATTLYLSHTDTCDSMKDHGVRKEFIEEDGLVSLKSKHSCLGADDGAGVYIMMKLIEAGISGKYLFTTGEEVGLVGMSYWIETTDLDTVLFGVERSVEFDRRGTNEIIMYQCGQKMATFDDAFKLSEDLCSRGMEMYPSNRGVFTDNLLLEGIVPNNYNIAVGYENQHTRKEYLDTDFVEQLLEAWIAMESMNSYSFNSRLQSYTYDDYMDDIPF